MCASNRFPAATSAPDIEPRFAAVSDLDDDVHLRDLLEGADATGCDRIGLIGFCMGGMYCFKASRIGSLRTHRRRSTG